MAKSGVDALTAKLVAALKARRAELIAELSSVDVRLGALTGVLDDGEAAPRAAKASKGEGKRVRRSRDQLEKMALDVLRFIRDKGQEGASGAEVKAKFGDLLPSVKAWLQKYGDEKVTTKGKRAATRYYLA